MATLEDLKPCEYLPIPPTSSVLAVGWLGLDQQYSTGKVSVDFFRKLCNLIQDPWEPFTACGIHCCELCQFSCSGCGQYEGMKVPSASGANVFVPGQKVILVSPVVVAHYIDAHHYLPPPEFIDAVLVCAEMRSMDYKKAILANGGRILVKQAGT